LQINAPFFGAINTLAFAALTSLRLEGRIPVDLEGSWNLIQSSPRLCKLFIDGMDNSGANTWAVVLQRMIAHGGYQNMTHLAFGGPKLALRFWISVACFLNHLGDTLQYLLIRARHFMPQPDTVTEMPPELRECLMHRATTQTHLMRLNIFWQALQGVDHSFVSALSNVFPNVESLHVYMVFPPLEPIQTLVEMAIKFPSLRRLSLVFPSHGQILSFQSNNQPHSQRLLADFEGALSGVEHPFAKEFLTKISDMCLKLERVSWIRDDPSSDAPENSLFVQVCNSDHLNSLWQN
jgi:hypothetical protein